MSLQTLVIIIILALPFVVLFDAFFVSRKIDEFGLLRLQKKFKSEVPPPLSKNFEGEKIFIEDVPIPAALTSRSIINDVRSKGGYKGWILSQSPKRAGEKFKQAAFCFFGFLAISIFLHLEGFEPPNQTINMLETIGPFLSLTGITVVLFLMYFFANKIFSIGGVFYALIYGFIFSFYLGGAVFLGIWISGFVYNFIF